MTVAPQKDSLAKSPLSHPRDYPCSICLYLTKLICTLSICTGKQTPVPQLDSDVGIGDTCHSLGLGRITPYPDRAYVRKLARAGSFGRIIVDDKHKLLYCAVPKAASTSWRTLLKNATGHPRAPYIDAYNSSAFSDILGLPRLGDLSVKEIQQRLWNKRYLMFVVVRHPIDRLMSSYKVFKRDMQQYGNYSERMPSFNRFLEFIVGKPPEHNKVLRLEYDNIHWRQQANLCFPCRLQYDHVIHLENMANEANVVLSRLSKSPNSLPFVNRWRQNAKQTNATNRPRLPPPNVVTALLKKYEIDFKLFGYSTNITHLFQN